MSDCLFCDIANKKIPGYIINEDYEYIAFLDIFPPTYDGVITMPGMTVVIPKKTSSFIRV